MAEALGISAAYVNMLERNQRSLSVPVLMALSEQYGIDWQDVVPDNSSTMLADLRRAFQHPVFAGRPPDIHELQAALDPPALVKDFLALFRNRRATSTTSCGSAMRRCTEASRPFPETTIHDFSGGREPFRPVGTCGRKACDRTALPAR